ncbi:MAG: hypothetical protein M3Y27_25635 [Acidobacteriota bacterium]|nr:hypothetical protein [Acidobacteriota bacterium]
MATQNNLYVPDDLLDQAQRIAKSQGRTADDLAADALKRYIEAQQNVQDLDELASWGEWHARERGLQPTDVERAIWDVRRGR